MRARRKFAARAAVCGAVLASLAACSGGDADPKAEDPTTAPSSATPSGSPTESPSETPSPAATGPVLEQPSARVSLPEGWHKLDQVLPVIIGGAKGTSNVYLGEVDSFDDSTNGELAKIALETLPNGDDLVRKPDIDVAGRQVYRLVTRPGAAAAAPTHYEELGTIYNDQSVSLVFDLDTSIPEAERKQIRDEVLASFQWK